MKLHRIILGVLLLGSISHAQKNKTIIKGTVQNWLTDTIYLQTMPFHSPYSSELRFQTLSKDSTFNFEFENSDKPFVVQLYASKKLAETNKEQLLFLNLTKDYYYGHCDKFYTYGVSTFLMEPNKVLNVNLKANRSIIALTSEKADELRKMGVKVLKNNTIESTNKTNVQFIGANIFQDEYFQKSVNLEDKVDKRLAIYKTKPIHEAIISYKKVKQKLLDNLETDKDKLPPIFYDFIKAEIEFGAKKEFLKFIMLSKEDELESFFSNEISKEVIDVIEFDKTKVNTTTLISESYNKFLMLYLNFKLNVLKKEYTPYYKFGFDKIMTAIKNFPKESVYYYLANHLLQTNREQLMEAIKNEEAVEELIVKTISKYPNGELNDKLIEKYDL